MVGRPEIETVRKRSSFATHSKGKPHHPLSAASSRANNYGTQPHMHAHAHSSPVPLPRHPREAVDQRHQPDTIHTAAAVCVQPCSRAPPSCRQKINHDALLMRVGGVAARRGSFSVYKKEERHMQGHILPLRKTNPAINPAICSCYRSCYKFVFLIRRGRWQRHLSMCPWLAGLG